MQLTKHILTCVPKVLTCLLTAALMLGCTTVPEQQADQELSNNDPLESVNRHMWDFNYDILDNYVLRPSAVVYRDYMPTPARKGLYNAANNLDEPSAVINNALQGKFKDAGISLSRFTINSTVGILGLFDIATKLGLEEKHEGFDETLGVYGVETGPYLMLPAYGPSDARSLVGNSVDSLYWPLSGLNPLASVSRVSVKVLEARISLMEQEGLLKDSFDPYTFVREAYFQRLAFKVNDGKVEPAPVEEESFEDFEAFEQQLEGL
ncbi:MlaA family lipoprotein [Algibacillus agarilyticus]|uniref:MlaA family lipoprotein n=1 Tax=Algibacillus agarilyticus TaxID=2234133 RepID=UPI002FCDE0C8